MVYLKDLLQAQTILIYKPISDGDITFVGNDGGNLITALTLDMSEASLATFNDNVGFLR